MEEAIRGEITEMVSLELKDPRLQGVTVTEVTLSPDGKIVSARLSIPGDKDAQKSTLAAMEHAKPFLRRELAQRLDLFRVPDMRFEADMSPALAARMDHLIKRIHKGRPRDGEAAENSQKTS